MNNYMSPIVVQSAVQLVIDRLTQAIIDGHINPGDKLPAESELAATFGVGRNTVREAIRTLVAYGVLEVRRPVGTFVCDTFNPAGINPLLYKFILKKKNSYDELVGLRCCVETGILEMLIEKNLAEKHVAALTHCVEELERIIKNSPTAVDQIFDADVNFHKAIAAATENQLIVYLNDMLTKLSLASRKQIIDELMNNGKGQYLIDNHYRLLDMIKNGKSADAHGAIQRSYFYWKDVYAD